MKLTEAEMRMVFQIESTNQNAALNEIYMTWRYAPNPATKETAKGLLVFGSGGNSHPAPEKLNQY